MRANKKNSLELLDVVQFSYNMQKSSATGYSPFEFLNGHVPVAPHIMLPRGFLRSPHAKKFLTA